MEESAAVYRYVRSNTFHSNDSSRFSQTLGEGIPGTVLMRLRGLCGGLVGEAGVRAAESATLLIAASSSSDEGVVAFSDPLVLMPIVDGGDFRLPGGDFSWDDRLDGEWPLVVAGVATEPETKLAHIFIMSSSRCRASRSSSCSASRSWTTCRVNETASYT